MMSEENSKNNVREFYDRVGWTMVDENLYQNARYEDLRPVSADYIHRCHMRINRHLATEGRFLLDAGSGPVQYPEYLTYSEGYQGRVCMDISIVALKEARKRLGNHGRFVVGDIARLPFKTEAFDGIVSLHTVHHVPMEDKLPAYKEMYRTLNPGKQMVVVNGWTNAPLMNFLEGFERFVRRLHGWWVHRVKGQDRESEQAKPKKSVQANKKQQDSQQPTGTYVKKLSAEWLTEMLEGKMDYEIFVWRSVSVSFLRSVIYPEWGGRFWLKILFWLEERFPRLLGRIGQYPLVVVYKSDETDEKEKTSTEV